MKISVAMASYNGEKYISEQLDSILIQLKSNDEVIISDDGSTDRTLEILKEYSMKDQRIKIYAGPGKGFVNNFENAIYKTTGDFIFLSDQDDIWVENKVSKILAQLTKNNHVVLHNFKNFDDKTLDISVQKTISYRKGFMKNLVLSSYWGCSLAFTREFKERILPFPIDLISHDQYIGLIAEYDKNIFFLDESLIIHRIHNHNQSRKRSLKDKIGFRLNLFKSLIRFFTRKKGIGNT